MELIPLPEGSACRGIAVSPDGIYYTTVGSNRLHSADGGYLFEAPEPIGGIDCFGDAFLCGGYSAPHALLYEIKRDGTVVRTVDFLPHIPPLYLPIEPYTRYVTGVTFGRRGSYWISLQNSKFIYNISGDGAFNAVRQVPLRESGEPIDLGGICSDDNTMYLTDIAESRVYCLNLTFGGVTQISLPEKFEPFGVHWHAGKLYVISANFYEPKLLVI